MHTTIFRFVLLQLVGLVLAVGIAHADTGGQAPPQNLAALWPMLGLAIANLTAYGSRKLSAKYTFFHTGAGSIVLALIGSVISAVTPIIQAHGLVWASLAWAAVGAATSFLASLNPSATAEEPPAKSPAAAGLLRAFLPLLLLPALLVAGCATAQKDTMVAELGLAKTVSLGYRTVDGIDKAKTDGFHNDILAGKAAEVRPQFDAYTARIKKALAGLAAGADLLKTADDLRIAADKGQRDWKDFTAYLPQLMSAGASIESLIADLKAVAQ